MDVSISEHVTLLCYAFVIGAVLGALYDIFRLARTFLGLGIDYADSPLLSRITPPLIGKRKKREAKRAGKVFTYAVIFVFDIVYMICATAVTVIFVYHAYSGTPRGFALAGEVIGFGIYMKTAGRLTAAAASYIFFGAETIIRYIVFFTVTPVRFIVGRISVLFAKLYRATLKRAVTAVIRKRASARLDRYINKDLKNTLAGIAEAVTRDMGE